MLDVCSRVSKRSRAALVAGLLIFGKSLLEGALVSGDDTLATSPGPRAPRTRASAPVPTLQLTIDATRTLRNADARWFGVNTAIWDSNFDTSATVALLEEMGTRVLRGPGGSLSDEYHWSTDTNLTNTWRWVTSFGNFAHVAAAVGAQAFLTVNYGTGTPNEAAAWVAYANGVISNSASLGRDSAGSDWQTVSAWAALRASARLARDDGRNFLRLSRVAPLSFQYWEIGNECYGSWETDTNAPAHDAFTYATRAREYIEQMKAVDPGIKIGVVATPGQDDYRNGNTQHPAKNLRTGQLHYGWTAVVLSTLKNLGVTPDFLVHHRYPEYADKANPAGSDNDARLLQNSSGWAADAADLRQQINDYFGPAGTNIELVCTENNSDAGAQGQQSTSLVNGLYYADSLAQVMKTEFNSFIWWDLRNGTDTSGWFDPSLYGWRNYGDLGMINGLDTTHPTFRAAKLMQFFVQPGDPILAATSNSALLSVYASRHLAGAVNLLVINKSPVSSFAAQMNFTGFAPSSSALVRSYGIPQDAAARTNGPAIAQDIVTNALAGLAAPFTNTFAPYSLTLLTLEPAAPALSISLEGLAPAQLTLQVQGQAGARYVLETSSDLTTWSPVTTNTLPASGLFTTGAPPSAGQVSFWRAVAGP